MRTLPIVNLLLVMTVLTAAAGAAAPSAPPEPQVVQVLEGQTIHWDKNAPVATDGEYVLRFAGQVAERTVKLPAPPSDPAMTPRITLSLRVEAIHQRRTEGGRRPNDPWTRMGSVAVLAQREPGAGCTEVELMRFITGYGAGGEYEEDVTAFAPLLTGTRTLRAFISTFSDDPGWRVSLWLTYTGEGAGYRRPVLVAPLLNDAHVPAERPGGRATLSAVAQIPRDVAPPRLRIISTGHATDGTGANEFISAPHVLLIDGREVARWRPWSESDPALRKANPWSGRIQLGGRTVWASDFDRSGWSPGRAVPPLIIPVPELTTGRHEIRLEIEGIRPPDDEGEHGYFAVSVVVLADEPLPLE